MSGTAAGVLVLVGSVIFFVGASLGVPGVFTESSPERRLAMLEDRLTAWRLAQPLYALGPLVAAVGIGVLAAAGTGSSRVALGLSCAALVAGALSWSWATYLRGVDHRAFAEGTLPGWPFAVYVWLTLAGLMALGVGLLLADFPAWVGWLTVAADVVFAAAYLRYRDIPPFVFYLLLVPVGIVIL
jgi:hypothetical protein